jgi:hypothetical protein
VFLSEKVLIKDKGGSIAELVACPSTEPEQGGSNLGVA